MNAWNTYKEELFAKIPSLRETLNEGVSEEDIASAEQSVGVAFPESLKALYLDADGDNEESACGMIMGFHFLSLDELVSECQHWSGIAQDKALNEGAGFSSKPEGCIKRLYANSKWIPICADGGGNFLGVDLDPDVNGRVGQVINFGRDEHNKAVLADSLDAFFERLTRVILSEDFFVGDFEGEEVVCLCSDDVEEAEFLTDYLKSDDSVK
ncbi:MAG: SMI1/KNR4 family protein [Ruminococcus sp.]|nr:SMI1/KNR4 family protein [Ruminococcus sp.]